MALDVALQDVLSLQLSYSSANTPEMQQRGRLIRQVIPSEIAQLQGRLALAARLDEADLLIEGRDGTGLKSEVPWVRFASRKSSPSATTGWYVVWLHRRDGAGVYLTLAHGSTTFVAGALIARSDAQLASLMQWGRKALGSDLGAHPRLTTTVDLATRAPLAVAYEKSSLAAFYYPKHALPTDEQAATDMIVMAKLLGRLYEADRLGQTPLSTSPEVADAKIAIEAITNPTEVKGGQGFCLTVAERTAVELRAMAVATAYFENRGYAVKDVSRKESFDLLGTRGDESIKIEVKGTTSTASSILLTKNEVELHRHARPHNALAVVHSIDLDKSGATPHASGGKLVVTQPWLIDELRLTALSFAYALGD